jgi:hypothetical protein
MKDPLKQPVPISTEVSLELLGYEGVAVCITNPTKQWRREFLAIDTMEAGEGESETDFERRKADALYRLVPYMVSSVTFANGGESATYSIETAADAQAVDEVDERIFEIVMGEAYERGVMGVLNARKTFRDERRELLVRTGAIRDGDTKGD